MALAPWIPFRMMGVSIPVRKRYGIPSQHIERLKAIVHTLNVGRNKLKAGINQRKVSKGVTSLSGKISVVASLICPRKIPHPSRIQKRVNKPCFFTVIYAILNLEDE